MKVHHHQQKFMEDPRNLDEVQKQDVEDLPIFSQLLKQGASEGGQRCYYCWTKTGYSVNFTSLGQ
jgi:hypothetical protein